MLQQPKSPSAPPPKLQYLGFLPQRRQHLQTHDWEYSAALYFLYSTFTMTVILPQEPERVQPQQTQLSSKQIGWEGMTLSYYQHSASHEIPEVCTIEHVLAIADTQTSVMKQCRLDGHFKRYLFHSGQSVITPAKSDYWSIREAGGSFLLLSLQPEFISQLAQDLLHQDSIELIPQFAVTDLFIQQIGLALKADLESGCTLGRLYGESLGTTLAVHLIKHYANQQFQIKNCNSIGKLNLQQAIDYIHTYLDRNLTLTDIANTTGISKYYFCRLFKQATGSSVYQYLLQQRVLRAKELLRQQCLPIAEIALQCGFANQTHFTKIFRRLIGITPKTYREN
jgi:AraC family transcriptional regulator